MSRNAPDGLPPPNQPIGAAARLGLRHSSSLTAQEMDFLFGERESERQRSPPSHAFLHAEKSGHLGGMSVLNAAAKISGSTESYFKMISTEIGKKAWLFAKLQPGRARKKINAT